MNILITGAQGFVGFHLIEYLQRTLKKDFHLFATYLHSRVSAHPEKEDSTIEWLNCDLTKSDQVLSVIEKAKPDHIYHLAAQASVPYSWKNPTETFQVNVIGTLHLLEALHSISHPCTLLVVESGEVYGIGDETITEKTPLSPQNPYAASKACQDIILLPYLNNLNLKIIRARPFNHIGPNQSTRFVVSNFANQIAAIETGRAKPILHVGNLDSERDFTDVRDVVHAYALLMEQGKSGEIYNIAAGKVVSIQLILDKLLKLSQTDIQVHQDSQRVRQNDISTILVSSDKLKKATGWTPEISLDQSLSDTLNHCREYFSKS